MQLAETLRSFKQRTQNEQLSAPLEDRERGLCRTAYALFRHGILLDTVLQKSAFLPSPLYAPEWTYTTCNPRRTSARSNNMRSNCDGDTSTGLPARPHADRLAGQPSHVFLWR